MNRVPFSRRTAVPSSVLTGLLVALLTLMPRGADAQPLPEGEGMDTHLFRPAVDSKGFFYVNGTDVVTANDVSFGLVLDWGHKLLRTEDPDAVGTDALIDNSFRGTISASYGIANMAVIGLTVPINVMIGDGPNTSALTGVQYDQLDSQKPASIVPHAKFRILRVQDGFGLAVVAQAGIPVADAARDFGTDPEFWYWPRVLAEKRFGELGKFKVGADVGYRGHTGNSSSIAGLAEGNLDYGDLVTYGLGFSYRALPYLDLVAENYGSMLVNDTPTSQAFSGEFLGGVKLFIEQNSYLMAAGGSRAVFSGFEAADVRVVLGFVYEPSIGDKDGDGILDDVDQCPNDPEDYDNFEDSDGCPEPDNDGDGILDLEDRCPNVPEDIDGDEDSDGCPEGDAPNDRDGDGIVDSEDKCPDEAEDRDGFEDEDGCPDPDNDKDGIPDSEDQCPDDAEDFDKFEDEDGCPELDNDLDRIPDTEDQCPQEPEVYNGFEDEDGCPDKGKVIIQGDDIMILEKIQFATGSSKILPQSIPIVDAVAATLKGHPEFQVIEVAGHADERGQDADNLRLTKERAASVRAALMERGVSSDRIVSQGYGEYCPLDRRSTAAAWEKNRRVEFKVVKTEDGMTSVSRGCTVARDAGITPPKVK